MLLWQGGERGAEEEKVRGEPRTSVGEGENRSKLETLFDACQRFIEPNNVGPEILAIGAHVFVRAVRQKLVVPAIAVVEVGEPHIIDGLREHVVHWPGRRPIPWRRRNQAVVSECVGSETVGEGGDRHVLKGATGWAASFVPHGVLAGDRQVVGEDQSIHRRSLGRVSCDDHVGSRIRETGDVIDGDSVERVLGP